MASVELYGGGVMRNGQANGLVALYGGGRLVVEVGTNEMVFL